MTSRAMLDQFIARATARDIDGFVALFADDAVMDFPFAGGTFAGKSAIDARIRDAWRTSTFALREYADLTTVASADAIVAEYVVLGSAGGHAIVVGQWRAQATVTATATRASITGLLIVRVRAGKIAHCWDYVDAMNIARVLGRPPFAQSTT